MLFNSSEWEVLTRSNSSSGVTPITKALQPSTSPWIDRQQFYFCHQHRCSRMSQKLIIRDCLTRFLRHSSSLFNLLSHPWCWSISRSLLRILKNCRIKFILCHVRFLKNWIVYTGFNGLIALDRKYLTYVDLCCQVFSNIFFEINSFKFESVKWQFQIT